MAHDVFICHSSKDKTVADAACAALEQHGIRCWIAPRDVLPGTSWAGSIVAAIEGAKLMLLIFSENANGSPQIEREIERAVNRRIPVVPFRIADILPTDALEYFISASHWLDAYSPPIDRHYRTLVAKIETFLAMNDPSAPAAPIASRPAPRLPDPPPARPAPRWGLIAGGGILVVLLAVAATAFLMRAQPAPRAEAPLPAAPAPVATVAAQPVSAAPVPEPAAANPPAPQPAYRSYPVGLDPHGDNWLALRSEPLGRGIRLDKLGPETRFEVVARQGGWSRVQLPDGRTGWVFSRFVGCCR